MGSAYHLFKRIDATNISILQFLLKVFVVTAVVNATTRAIIHILYYIYDDQPLMTTAKTGFDKIEFVQVRYRMQETAWTISGYRKGFQP